MDAGGLAGCIDGKLVTIWRREREMYRCEPGKTEESLGRGVQGWAATGPKGVHLVWLTARPGGLLALNPGESKPITLSNRAIDPVVAGSVNGKGPVIAVWEEHDKGSVRLLARTLAPGAP